MWRLYAPRVSHVHSVVSVSWCDAGERWMIIPSSKLLCSRYLSPRCAAHPQNQGGHCHHQLTVRSNTEYTEYIPQIGTI